MGQDGGLLCRWRIRDTYGLGIDLSREYLFITTTGGIYSLTIDTSGGSTTLMIDTSGVTTVIACCPLANGVLLSPDPLDTS